MTVLPPAVVWDPRFRDYDFGGDHPFSETSRDLAVQLFESTLAPEERDAVAWIREVPPSSRAELERFHDRGYLDFMEEAGLIDQRVYLDRGDTPAFPGCFEASARLAGGALAALRRTLESGRPAFHPGGGLHHAHPDRASGFCVLNDLAVAIAEARSKGLKVAYLDIDAHHGDGVMYGFYGDGGVLDLDFHQDGRTLFPGTGFPSETGRGDGRGLKVNVPLPPTAGDEALLPIFRRVVPPMIREFRPDLIVLQHGVDGHVGDPLAHLQYTPSAYAEVDRTMLALAEEHSGGRLLVTGGGGYRPESVTRVLARTGRILGHLPTLADSAPLPGEWRVEFFDSIGTVAPAAWGETGSSLPSRWRPELETSLVSELEAALGRSFPRP